MRRRWGKKFQFLQNLSFNKPKPYVRKWGRGFSFPRISAAAKAGPRKWGTRRIGAAPRLARPPRSPRAARPARSSRSGRRLGRKNLAIILVLVFLFLVIQGFRFLDRELREPLMFLAKIRITQMATEAINAAITDEIAQSADTDKLIQWKTDPAGKINGFLIDYKEQMGLTAKTIEVVNRVLKQREEVPERIPIGHALNSPFLSSIGPKVSVSFHPVSAIKVDVETQQTETGINMLLVEVYIRIRTDIAVVVPFDQEPEVLESKIPLSYVLVVGDVPTYYYDNKGNPVGNGAAQAPPIQAPTIALPSLAEPEASKTK